MTEQPFNIHFYQYSISGAFDQAMLTQEHSELKGMFDKAIDAWGEGSPQNTLGNAINIFCGNTEISGEEATNMTRVMTKILISAYLARNKPDIDENKVIDIDICELCEQYNIDSDDLISAFKIFVLRNNQVQTFSMDQMEQLPPQVQALIKATSESKGTMGVAKIDPLTGECTIIDPDKDIPEEHKEAFEKSVEHAKEIIDFDQMEQAHSTHTAPKSVS